MSTVKIKYASYADAIAPKLNEGYIIKESVLGGLGLFANINFNKGDLICGYDGLKVSAKELEHIESTHTIHIPNSVYYLDGLPLRLDLVKDERTGYYVPKNKNLLNAGWGCIVNSSRNDIDDLQENAKIEFICNDHSIRDSSYDVFNQDKCFKSLENILEKKPFLFAKKEILIGQEILWDYNFMMSNKRN